MKINTIHDIKIILERLKENEEITRKFHDVEAKFLSILNYRDLFETLLGSIQDTFNVPYVWISLIENSEASNLIKYLEMSDVVSGKMNIIDIDSLQELIGIDSEPLLVNEDLRDYYKLFPDQKKYFIKSIAMVPIYFDGKLIGSLNQGDMNENRFKPGMDTSLLERLAMKVSLCISNVTAHEKLRLLAYQDPLTGLLNRRALDSALKRELVRSNRYSNIISLLFIDLDNFKPVNDNYGHDFGDELLVYFSKNLLNVCRETDIAARYAGDEFVLVLPETDFKNADNLINRLRDNINKSPLRNKSKTIPVSFSCGISTTSEPDMDTPAKLIKKADERLYKEKSKKKKDETSYKQGNVSTNIISFSK
ncbi:MAG: DUF484 family protein [Desulfobacterales bacterium]|nr:DUF484 family protein [Desulfobacterales bacterium]